MGDYSRHRLLTVDPFCTVDGDGVGELIRLAIERGRAVRADMSCGVCGEHGGDPASIAFFHRCGVNYISCSPMRLPVARLAAAHAAI
jgi:pyruvate,orthophosphate dikinase